MTNDCAQPTEIKKQTPIFSLERKKENFFLRTVLQVGTASYSSPREARGVPKMHKQTWSMFQRNSWKGAGVHHLSPNWFWWLRSTYIDTITNTHTGNSTHAHIGVIHHVYMYNIWSHFGFRYTPWPTRTSDRHLNSLSTQLFVDIRTYIISTVRVPNPAIDTLISSEVRIQLSNEHPYRNGIYIL